MIKQSMMTLGPLFNTERMLLEYYHDMYLPTAKRSNDLSRNSHAMAKEIADWKSKLHTRFASLRLLNFVVEGFNGDIIHVDDTLSITVNIDAGKMNPDEIRVEMIVDKKEADADQGHDKFTYVPLKMTQEENPSSLTFSARYTIPENGLYYYGVRVMPYHPLLSSKVEGDLVLWG